MIICKGIAIIEVIEETEEDEEEEQTTDASSYTIEINGDDLNWEAEGQGERSMGAEIHHYGTYTFEDGEEIIWTVYEYPEGSISGEVQVEVSSDNYELLKNFDGFSFTP